MAKRYEVTFDVQVPDTATYQEVCEWVRFSIGATNDLKTNNPIYEKQGSDINAIRTSVIVILKR